MPGAAISQGRVRFRGGAALVAFDDLFLDDVARHFVVELDQHPGIRHRDVSAVLRVEGQVVGTLGRLLLVPVFAVLAIYYGRSVEADAPIEALRWWALGGWALGWCEGYARSAR